MSAPEAQAEIQTAPGSEGGGGTERRLNMIEAINEALDVTMARDGHLR